MKGLNILQFSKFLPEPLFEDSFGKGGYRCVDTVFDRNNIPYSLRKKGMIVYVEEKEIVYKLIYNPETNLTEDSHWRDLRGGSA